MMGFNEVRAVELDFDRGDGSRFRVARWVENFVVNLTTVVASTSDDQDGVQRVYGLVVSASSSYW